MLQLFLQPPLQMGVRLVRNAFILASPTLLFLAGIPTASLRLTSTSVTPEQERTYAWAFLIGAAILTFFTTWANVANLGPDLARLLSNACKKSYMFPCHDELRDVFGMIFVFAFHPVLLSALLLYVNDTDWKEKDTIKRWLWVLLIISVLIYCANGVFRYQYWFKK